MNKQEITNEINKTKEHLANLEKMLKECEYKRWKPKTGEEYYFLDSDIGIQCYCFSPTNVFDIERIKTYNYFRTKEEARQEAEKILVRRMLEDIASRLNKGRKLDWNDYMQFKRYIFFDNSNQMIGQESNTYSQRQGTVYCLDENFKKVAIKEIGEERLKKYLRGE